MQPKRKPTPIQAVSLDLGFELVDCGEESLGWLEARGITPDLIQEFGIKFSWNVITNKIDWGARLFLPVYRTTNFKRELVFWQARDIFSTTTPKYVSPLGAPKSVFKNYKHGGDTMYVVEDMLSAIRLSPFVNSVALMGNNLNSSALSDAFLEVDHIVLWLDKDLGGDDGVLSTLASVASVLWDVSVIQQEEPKLLTNEQILETLHNHDKRLNIS